MKRKVSNLVILSLMVALCAAPALAQSPVIYDIGTSTGSDTLFVGIPGSIIFFIDANGNNVQGTVFPFEFIFTGGNWVGPLNPDPPLSNVVPSAALVATFASIAWNPNYGQGTDPDTMLYGATSFGGPFTAAGEAFRFNITPTGPGTMEFRAIRPPESLPPANVLDALDPAGASLPLDWRGDGKLLHSVIRPNVPPTCDGVSQDASTVVFGNPITGTIAGIDPDLSPQQLSFLVFSAINDAGTGPNNPLQVDAAGNWVHNTSNANNNDVGNWTVIFATTDGVDTFYCDPITYTVIAEQPLVCFGFGCAEAFSGTEFCIPLELRNFFNPCKEIGGFDLLFTYDPSLLTFTGLNIEGSVLATAGWEYLTYRIVSDNPAKVRIVAIADMNNSNQHPQDYCVEGRLANVCFRTTNDRNLACQAAWLSFCWDDCGDNSASSRDGNDLFIVADPANGPWVGGVAGVVDGGGIINACIDSTADIQLFTGDGGLTGPADHPCPNADPNKPNAVECLYFVNGKIKIKCPGDIDDRGDLNLNGLAYEIADAVLYSSFFIQGPSVWAAGIQGEAQVAASDINADGSPLTVADLVYLIRVITGDAEPIAEDLLGGGPKVATTVGTINVEALAQGVTTTITAASDLDMGAGVFTLAYQNTDITEVNVVGRASDMDVEFHAESGELRVLLYNIEDGHKVAAGSGEILSVMTTGGGELELVEVEAASFMGGVLESNVTAKVLPTQFALHQNYPNPFNPSTSMAIDFPTASDYKLTIYNIAGQTVKTYSGAAEAGTLTLTWDGRDSRGSQVATGVYFYAIQAGDNALVNKMVLLK